MDLLRKRSSRIAACAATIGMLMMPAGAVAKITPVDTQCTTNGGQQPGGQQPSCKGGGLTRSPRTGTPPVGSGRSEPLGLSGVQTFEGRRQCVTPALEALSLGHPRVPAMSRGTH
jgi:hypothetical protein